MRTLRISATILQRFGDTHHATVFAARERHPGDFPALACLPAVDRPIALDEYRLHQQTWAFLVSRTPVA